MTHPTAYAVIERSLGEDTGWEIATFFHQLDNRSAPILSGTIEPGETLTVDFNSGEEGVYVEFMHPERVHSVPFVIAERIDILNIRGLDAEMCLTGTFLDWNEDERQTRATMVFKVYT